MRKNCSNCFYNCIPCTECKTQDQYEHWEPGIELRDFAIEITEKLKEEVISSSYNEHDFGINNNILDAQDVVNCFNKYISKLKGEQK